MPSHYQDNKTAKGGGGKRMKAMKKKMMCPTCKHKHGKKHKARKKYPSMEISNKNVMSGKRKRKQTAKGRSYNIPSLSTTVPKRLGKGAEVKRTA